MSFWGKVPYVLRPKHHHYGKHLRVAPTVPVPTCTLEYILSRVRPLPFRSERRRSDDGATTASQGSHVVISMRYKPPATLGR